MVLQFLPFLARGNTIAAVYLKHSFDQHAGSLHQPLCMRSPRGTGISPGNDHSHLAIHSAALLAEVCSSFDECGCQECSAQTCWGLAIHSASHIAARLAEVCSCSSFDESGCQEYSSQRFCCVPVHSVSHIAGRLVEVCSSSTSADARSAQLSTDVLGCVQSHSQSHCRPPC